MEPADALDVRQIFFSNLLLLGFDPTAMERKWRILFKKDMFDFPNKKAFEVVMYFLFERLSPTKCRNEFRDCWPVCDKKTEQEYRKVCNNWLVQISKEESDAHLPRINASTFLAPGGSKFYQLVFCFSKFVLVRVMAQEHGLRQREFLRPPVLTPSTVQMSVAMERTLECATIRGRRAFLKQVHQAGLAQEQWRQYAGELVKEYRGLKKTNHDKERVVRRQAQQAREANDQSLSASPMGKGRKGGDLHKFDFDIESVQRAQLLQKVREMWKVVDGFVTGHSKHREIVSAVLSGEDDRYTVDGRHMNVRVPDMLLRTCEREIQRRNVDNIYDGGKLNLLSLVHLSNLCLHLFIEKLHQVGLPDLEDVVPEITAQLHKHQVHLAKTKQLEKKVEAELIPVLKASIKELKERLDTKPCSRKSPSHGGHNSRGVRKRISKMKAANLQLTAPTPPANFDPADPGDTFGASFLEQLSKPLDNIATPEAAVQLMTSVRNQILSGSSTSSASFTTHRLAQGRPVYAPSARITDTHPVNTRSRLPIHKSPKRGKSQPTVGMSPNHPPNHPTTGEGIRRQPYGDDAPTLVHSSTTFTEPQQPTTSAKQRLHDQKSNQELRSSSDSNDSFLEWLSSSGRLTLSGNPRVTEDATNMNHIPTYASEGFVTTSTPHDSMPSHVTSSENLSNRNATPTHRATTTHRDTPTHRDMPTHRATPTHQYTPTHRDPPTHQDMPTNSATPTHRDTPTHRATSTHRATPTHRDTPPQLVDTSQRSVRRGSHSDPIVTTLFTDEYAVKKNMFPETDKWNPGSNNNNAPKSSIDQQIDSLADHVMSESGLPFVSTGDRVHFDDELIDDNDVHHRSLLQHSYTRSSTGGEVSFNGRDAFSASNEQDIVSDVGNAEVGIGEKYSFHGELVGEGISPADSEEEFRAESGERVIEVQDGSFSEFYVKTPSKSRDADDELTNGDIRVTLSSLKRRMMQMEKRTVDEVDIASTRQNYGESTMNAGNTFEQTAHASSDIGNLIARYNKLRTGSNANENGQCSTTDSASGHTSPMDSVDATLHWSAAGQEVNERRTDSDNSSSTVSPHGLSERFDYESLIALSESLRETAASIRDNSNVAEASHSTLLDDDFSDIQEQLRNMSPYGGSPSPARLSTRESYEQTSLKRPELSVTPMSPFMARLHGIDNTGQHEDIMDEHDSILVPTSPSAEDHRSPDTGRLIDLSF